MRAQPGDQDRPHAATIHVGTSGWHYGHWRGPFYPANLPSDQFLAYYAHHLPTVEINNSFYRLPSPSILEKWRDAVPPGFIFAVKASGFITHRKKLQDPEHTLAPFLERIALLGDKLGPILFQLPPHWQFNAARLAAFLAALPATHRYALELRDRSWINAGALNLLAARGAAFCIYELDGYRSPLEVTADFVYIRLHGPGGPYQGQYDLKTLAAWAEAIAGWSRQGREVFCYFDNDDAGHAAQNALQLQDLLLKEVCPTSGKS
jgi:uncharacterized protein YecE (DUF72 family)